MGVDTVSVFGESVICSNARRFMWNQGVLGPDGRIYCSPAMNHEVGLLVIEPPGFKWTPVVSRFFPPSFVRVLRLLLLIRQQGAHAGSFGALPKDVFIDRIFAFFQRDWFSDTCESS